ncbi:FecCD family ABC transporter permease [Streptomyces reniochalinae]|uniref:FecCD family ABC transporter permease n=1 Tax=Streptomyces reniochalinae TaxID=2250578 RepID=UPI0015EFDD82|nr:iron ABC transporter permease [Streptomyces reniochalinae]
MGTGRPSRQTGTVLTAGLLALVAVLATVAWLSLAVGSGPAGAGDAWRTVFDADPADKAQLLIREVRVPRTAAGLLAGVALGLAGTLIQGLTRNPLADPGLLGLNSGASAAVVFAIGVLGLTASEQYIWFGFLGALLATMLVYGVGSLGREGATPVKLALAGAATSALLLAVTTAQLLTDSRTFDQYRFWQVGSLAEREPAVLWQASPFIAVGALLALCLGPLLNVLSLGDDLARSLGQRVGHARLLCGGVVVLLCGAATVVAGPLAFVGLVVPHAARLVTGPDYRWTLLYSAVLAPLLVLASDIVGRLVARPGEVQVGVLTALVGAVPFVVLVRRRDVAGL